MKEILFITGNKRKAWQAQTALKPYGIGVKSESVELPEIQAHDPLKIAITKAEAAHSHFKRPLVVCDHSWNLPALNGFPGGYMQDMNTWFKPEDWLALLRDKADRSVTLTETVVYIDNDSHKHFSVEFWGKVIKEPRGRGHVSCEQVIVFDGTDKTIAEHIDADEHARDMTNSAWRKFAEWYSIEHLRLRNKEDNA